MLSKEGFTHLSPVRSRYFETIDRLEQTRFFMKQLLQQ